MDFYLGAHRVHWLESAPVPLFISYRQLGPRKRLPRARTTWALDSGGFSELSCAGTWSVAPRTYADHVRRYQADVGRLEWAAVQDWMCEESLLARTGLSVKEHQRRTTQSYLELRDMVPEVPWVPVLQGWAWGDHFEHVEQYLRAGVDLTTLPLVGFGSVCRRQQTIRTSLLISSVA